MRTNLITWLPIAALSLTISLTGCGNSTPAEGAGNAAAAADKAGNGDESAAEVAKQSLLAFKAKDVDAFAATIVEKQRAEAKAGAAKMFDASKPYLAAMREWDGKTVNVRYAGSEALVHFGPADGRLAVLEMDKGADGKWYVSRPRYRSADEFAAWGSEDPNAPVPACNGGGKHVDTRPLPAAWAEHGGAPQGAVACAFDSIVDNQFSFELGSGPEEAAKAWRAHLVASGWAVEEQPDEHGTVLKAVREDLSLRVFTSKDVTNVGWTSVTFTATP